MTLIKSCNILAVNILDAKLYEKESKLLSPFLLILQIQKIIGIIMPQAAQGFICNGPMSLMCAASHLTHMLNTPVLMSTATNGIREVG